MRAGADALGRPVVVGGDAWCCVERQQAADGMAASFGVSITCATLSRAARMEDIEVADCCAAAAGIAGEGLPQWPPQLLHSP